MTVTNHNYCIILAGGIGSRLWPYSNQHRPKQFLDLFGTGKTLLQSTHTRFRNILPEENIYISVYEDYVDLVREQLPDISPSQIITEPVQLSTAPAVALTAAMITAKDPDANFMISPADQLILNNEVFKEQVLQGFEFVSTSPNFLVLGVKATTPETCYGYLQAGGQTENGFACVKSFTEKPNLDFARFFVESGEFYWSTGLFMCHNATLFKALEADYPDISSLIDMKRARNNSRQVHTYIREHYPRMRYQSFDMLVLEHNQNVYIEPCTFGWRDIGSWMDFYQISLKDGEGNVTMGANATMYNCKNNVVVIPSGKIVLLQDLENYLVIEKDNLIMICKKDDLAQIRRMMTDAEVKYGTSLT